MNMHSDKYKEAFLSALGSNKSIIYKVANSYCRDEEDKKDLIQEIIIQLWLSFDRYDEQFRLSTRLYRIALNVSISFYRKEKKRDQINQPLSEVIIQMCEDDEPDDMNQGLKRLQQFISELKKLDKALILLYLDGYDQNEIAEIMGLSPSNVSTKIYRIKKKLRKKFSAR